MSLSTRLLALAFLSVVIPMIGLTVYLQEQTSRALLSEKEDKLFGLARQLDNALPVDFESILSEEGATGLDREGQIGVLNARLRETTDFVASGNPGVGVGYYSRKLDAVITYGPSGQFQYTVGQSIFPGHKGYEVMATGTPMVQKGALVRGDILNCMWPIQRDGDVVGYIWANETLDRVDGQLKPIISRILLVDSLIVILIYLSVTLTMKSLLDKVSVIQKGIRTLFDAPTHHLPEVSGELSIIVHTINDLVDATVMMRQYEREMQEKERSASLGDMALTVVHEVKNPMTSVKGFAQLLRRPDLDEATRDRYLKLIDDELNRVNRLLNEMLVYGGRSRLEKRQADVCAVVRDALARNDWSAYGTTPMLHIMEISRQSDTGNIKGQEEDNSGCRAEIDIFRMGQVLDNVLLNACEAVAERGSGKIVVLVRDRGGAVEIRVVDSGIGIAPDTLPRIGNPLFSTKKRGTGFGLAVSRKLVEAHGGTLTIDSVEMVYTRVSIVLPKKS